MVQHFLLQAVQCGQLLRGKTAVHFTFNGANGIIQEFLDLHPFFRGIKKLAAVIDGTGFRSDVAFSRRRLSIPDSVDME